MKRINSSESQLQSKRQKVVTPGLAAALDRTKTSNRSATFVISETFRSAGHNPDNIVLSRQTVRRKRMVYRQSFAKNLKDSFKANVPLTAHWDGKMMTDIVDRLPVVISGCGVNQLLCVPKLVTGTGENIAAAVCSALEDWGVSEHVSSLCFDTTSTNTGSKKGACVLIEQKLGRPLLYLACRHHILKILLDCVVIKSLGPSSGPEIKLFQRFKSQWEFINQTEFKICDLEIKSETKDEILSFCFSQLQECQPRDDYKEFLELAIITLGGMPRSLDEHESNTLQCSWSHTPSKVDD